jgi:prepilin-type N-terminal cleavage/methylation domain-containing protein
MNKKKGFTLIELLTVVVILGLVLMVGIPGIIKVMNRSKKDVFIKNESMLKTVAKNYITKNNISFEPFETKEFSYTELKNNNIISSLTDPISKTECSKSKIFVTKTGGADLSKVRYIRNYINGSSTNTSNHWIEVQAIDQSGNNIALSKTVTGSVAQSASYPYSRITDGVIPVLNTAMSSYAQSSVSGLQWVEIDLGAEYNLKEIKLWHYVDGRAYNNNKVDVRDNNGVTTTVLDKVYNEFYSGYTISAEPTYDYKPGLVCDNYISIDTFDLLEGAGNFENDDDNSNDGNRFGCNCSATVYSVSSTEKYRDSKSQKCALPVGAVSASVCVYMKDSLRVGLIDITHKYYLSSAYKKEDGGGAVVLNLYNATKTLSNMTSNDIARSIGKWYVYGNIVTLSSNATNTSADSYRVYVYTNAGTGATTTATTYVDDTILLDLTNIYGAGSEPTATFMRNVIENSR